MSEPGSVGQLVLAVFTVTMTGSHAVDAVRVQYASQPGTATGGASCQPALGSTPDFVAQTGR